MIRVSFGIYNTEKKVVDFLSILDKAYGECLKEMEMLPYEPGV